MLNTGGGKVDYILEKFNINDYEEQNCILYKCENDNGIFKKNDIILIKDINKVDKNDKTNFILSDTKIGHVIGYVREDNIIEL